MPITRVTTFYPPTWSSRAVKVCPYLKFRDGSFKMNSIAQPGCVAWYEFGTKSVILVGLYYGCAKISFRNGLLFR